MTNLKEMKFAFEHGFTKVEKGLEEDGCVYYLGTFGYIATDDKEFILAADELIREYVKEEEKLDIKLTDKELKVFNCLVENTFEYGLPVSVDEIKEDTGMSKKSIVGVISSLYKKGVVEEYIVCGEDEDEFILCEKYIDFIQK